MEQKGKTQAELETEKNQQQFSKQQLANYTDLVMKAVNDANNGKKNFNSMAIDIISKTKGVLKHLFSVHKLEPVIEIILGIQLDENNATELTIIYSMLCTLIINCIQNSCKLREDPDLIASLKAKVEKMINRFSQKNKKQSLPKLFLKFSLIFVYLKLLKQFLSDFLQQYKEVQLKAFSNWTFVFKLIINICSVVAGALPFPIGIPAIKGGLACFGRDISQFVHDKDKLSQNTF